MARKRSKDPNAPKRNLSAYLLYQNAMRDPFKSLHPEMTFGQLAKYTSAMYSQMPAAEKEKWTVRAEDDKARYLFELESYTPPPGFDSKGDAILFHNDTSFGNGTQDGVRVEPGSTSFLPKRAKRKAKDKDPRLPKRVCGPYLFFTKTMRPVIMEQFPGIQFNEMGRVLGERWRSLSSEEKKRFEDMANEDKMRYKREMELYMAEQNQREMQLHFSEQTKNPIDQVYAQNQQHFLPQPQHVPFTNTQLPPLENPMWHVPYPMDMNFHQYQYPHSDYSRYPHYNYNSERI